MFKKKLRPVRAGLLARLLHWLERRRLNPYKIRTYGGTRWAREDA